MGFISQSLGGKEDAELQSAECIAASSSFHMCNAWLLHRNAKTQCSDWVQPYAPVVLNTGDVGDVLEMLPGAGERRRGSSQPRSQLCKVCCPPGEG